MLAKPFPWEDKKNILITAHAFVDPDALGSILTMASFLAKLGKNVTLVAVGGIPRNLRFLAGDLEVLPDLPKEQARTFDLIIVLDCADQGLPDLPDLLGANGPPILNMDHHLKNSLFGKFNWVDTDYAAVALMIYDLLKEAGHKIDAFEATAMLAGIMADTGSFRHSNTTAKVLKAGGDLLLKGAAISSVVKYLFAGKTAGQLRAWSYVLELAQLDRVTGALISALTEEDIKRLDVDDTAYQGIVEIMNTFPGAKFSAFVMQRGDEVKFSFRSEEYKGVDVSEIARRLGGGGHKLAAGATMAGRLKRENGNIYIEPVGFKS